MEAETKPKVSVCVVTYNHEKFIRQCLQSIVDQETDFVFEVIVVDDCSTDGTRAIVEEFAGRYPGVVKPVLHDKNIGATKNYFAVHNQAKGMYVAHLDGDDFALPGKLQALANHLDRHEDCAIVWHRMYILDEKGNKTVGMPVVPLSQSLGKTKLYQKDLATYYGFTGCHSGSMYRSSTKKLASSIDEVLDYYITLSFCSDGYCAMYIDQPYGVYRFFKNESTVTRAKGSTITGKYKLLLMRDYLKTNKELAPYFASQCLFEIFLRCYLRYPLILDYVRMMLGCRSLPKIMSVIGIIRVFMSNRNTALNNRMNDQ